MRVTFILLCAIAGVSSRTMIMTSWTGSGTKGARYETVASNFFDANGNIVANKANPRKGAGGSTVFDCVDVQGKVRAHGEEYLRPNGHFKFRCNNGIEEVAACIGSERSGKAVIKVNDTNGVIKADSFLEQDGYTYRCTFYKGNQTAIYTEDGGCTVGDRKYRVGETVRSGFFLMTCEKSGYKIVGCFYRSKNGETVDMKPGTTAEADGTVHYCDDNDGNIQYHSKGSTGCKKNGKDYKEGQKYSANHLNYECSGGTMEVTGCYITEGRSLEIGKDVVEKGMVYRCYRKGGAVQYEEYACGFRGTPSCTPPVIPKTPDDVPSLSHGLKAPGFGSFSIVQHVKNGGDKMASGSNTVVLQFPKRN